MNVEVKTAYKEITGRKHISLLLISAAIFLTFVIDIMTGPASLSVSEVISTILFPAYSEPSVQVIVWTFRLPVALMAIVIGIALGLAGANMQTILDNPLASPYTLGISAAAGFGAALAIVLGVGVLPFADTLFVPVNAFVFSLISCMAIYGIARFKKATSETIVLTGIAVLFLFNSLLGLLEYKANPEQVQAIVFWLFGSLTKTNWTTLRITVGIVLVVIPLLAIDVWKLTALRLGDDKAKSLGVDVERMRIKGLILISVLTATAVAFVGTIGFIGLVSPHIARMLVGEDHRYFLPCSALSGAFILSTASILSKIVVPGIIFPIGILTSLIGIPFFIWLLLSKKKGYW
ncbi:TPA: iron ABC transporter permease [Methanosarcina acetivorans]|nr:iron ABC transporter permease [Methanosarcina acetivorans]HIH93693.1 iron ABC transporter permease [Methanosarcina acetivorans]